MTAMTLSADVSLVCRAGPGAPHAAGHGPTSAIAEARRGPIAGRRDTAPVSFAPRAGPNAPHAAGLGPTSASPETRRDPNAGPRAMEALP